MFESYYPDIEKQGVRVKSSSLFYFDFKYSILTSNFLPTNPAIEVNLLVLKFEI